MQAQEASTLEHMWAPTLMHTHTHTHAHSSLPTFPPRHAREATHSHRPIPQVQTQGSPGPRTPPQLGWAALPSRGQLPFRSMNRERRLRLGWRPEGGSGVAKALGSPVVMGTCRRRSTGTAPLTDPIISPESSEVRRWKAGPAGRRWPQPPSAPPTNTGGRQRRWLSRLNRGGGAR